MKTKATPYAPPVINKTFYSSKRSLQVTKSREAYSLSKVSLPPFREYS